MQYFESKAAMKNNNPTRAWALMVAMSVLAATAVMADQPGQLPEQVAVCAALQMVPATDTVQP